MTKFWICLVRFRPVFGGSAGPGGRGWLSLSILYLPYPHNFSPNLEKSCFLRPRFFFGPFSVVSRGSRRPWTLRIPSSIDSLPTLSPYFFSKPFKTMVSETKHVLCPIMYCSPSVRIFSISFDFSRFLSICLD